MVNTGDLTTEVDVDPGGLVVDPDGSSWYGLMSIVSELLRDLALGALGFKVSPGPGEGTLIKRELRD